MDEIISRFEHITKSKKIKPVRLKHLLKYINVLNNENILECKVINIVKLLKVGAIEQQLLNKIQKCINSYIKQVDKKSKIKTCKTTQIDSYTKDFLIKRYTLHKNYVVDTKHLAKEIKLSIRLPGIPEDISENMIKFIIRAQGDKTVTWDCKGDLISKKIKFLSVNVLHQMARYHLHQHPIGM